MTTTSESVEVPIMDFLVENLLEIVQKNNSNQFQAKTEVKEYLIQIIAAFLVHKSFFNNNEDQTNG